MIAFTYGIITPVWIAPAYGADYFVSDLGGGGGGAGETFKKRKYRKFGFSTDFFGDPFPSLNSLNFNWNMSKLTRIHVGGGISRSTTTSSKTYGGGLDFTFNKWVFSPIISVNYAIVKNNPYGMQTDSAIPGVRFKQDVGGTGGSSYAHLYWSAGGELRLFKKVLVLGAGYKASLKKDIGGWGYATIGLYFK